MGIIFYVPIIAKPEIDYREKHASGVCILDYPNVLILKLSSHLIRCLSVDEFVC